MDDATHTRLLRCADEAIELVEFQLGESDDGWAWLANSIAQRDDGSLNDIFRMLCRIAASQSQALVLSTGDDLDTILTRARVALVEDIERHS